MQLMHCEISIILETCQKLKLKYLDNMTMFVTLEPCSSVQVQLVEVHIKSLYFGAYDEKNGGIEKIRVVKRK